MSLLRSLKRAVLGHHVLEGDYGLSIDRSEHMFRSPPLTEGYLAAVKLIAPQYEHLVADEKSRAEWEHDQNVSCSSELRALQPAFQMLPKPRKVLEIGPGVGRSVVCFSKKLDWQGVDIHVYEGDGSATKYTKLGPRFEDSFCGNLAILKETLKYNGIDNVTVHDAKGVALKDLPGPFDLIYSFYSIGFHWSLEHFLDDLLALVSNEGTIILTVPATFEAFPRLEALSFATLPLFPKAKKASRRHQLLVLRKSAFPPGFPSDQKAGRSVAV